MSSAGVDLSVVIPTRDRRPTLLATIERLDAQRLDGLAAELVVVDNGSSDGTPQAVEARSGVLPLRLLHEPRPGPAAARNRGVEAARAPLVLFLGDDMAPADDDLLAGHVRRHAGRPRAGLGILGRVMWRPDLPVTPFMFWLEHGGPQFDFFRMQPGPVSPATHLITAHVSLERQVLLDAGGFDERFPYAAVEDAELGLRLDRRGVVLDYVPELLVLHDHFTSLDAAVARMVKVGESARILHEIHPDEAATAFVRPRGRWRLYPAAARAARALLLARPPAPLRERAWVVLMLDAYARGYLRRAG